MISIAKTTPGSQLLRKSCWFHLDQKLSNNMINLLELINDSTNSKVYKTVRLSPTDDSKTFWKGTVRLCGKGLKNDLKSRNRCKTSRIHKNNIVVSFKSSVIKVDTEGYMTIKMPEEAIKSTKCMLYISDKKLILQMAKTGENGLEISRRHLVTNPELNAMQRPPWERGFERTSIGHEQHLDDTLKPLSSGLRSFLVGKPHDIVFELVKRQVQDKTIEVLSELVARSPSDNKFMWHENHFNHKLKYDSDPLTNEVIHRCLTDSNQQR